MGWFSFFRNRRPPSAPANVGADAPDPPPPPQAPLQLGDPEPLPLGPQQVRRLLFDAVASRDESKLESLCREHKQLIFDHGLDWLTVPPEFRSNPELARWYANGLRSISRFCAERLGHDEMLKRLEEAEARLADARPSH